MIRPTLTCKKFFLAVVLSFFGFSLIAADRYSVATGNWNDISTWSATSGGLPGASFPVAGDNVFIEGGFTVTTAADAACANLSIANGSTLSVGGFNITVSGTTSVAGIISFTSAVGTKLFTGLATIIAGGTWNNSTNNAPVNFRGGVSNSGTFNAGTGTYTFNTNNQALTGTLSIPNVTVTGVTLTNNGTLTVSTALAGTGGLTQAVNATLNLGGTSLITTLTATNNGNTVNFSGAAQTAKVSSYYNLTLSGTGVKTFATTPTVNGILSMEGTATVVVTAGVVTYGANATLRYNTATARTATAEEWIVPSFAATGGVIIANTGIITMNVAKVFNASVPLTINGGATLATNNLQLTFGGNFINGGSLSAGSSPIVITNTMVAQSIGGFTTTGVVLLSKTTGTATFTGNVNGGGLTINGVGGTLNLGSGLTHTFTGTWTRTNGTLNGGSSLLRIGGSVSGTGGTFTAGSGTVEWYAAGAQTCAGVSYNNLTISGSGTKTLGGAATVDGTLTLTSGSFAVAGNTLTLNGPTIAGTPANLVTAATSSLVFGGTTAGVLIPTSVVALNGLSITNTNIVTLQSSVTVSGTFNPAGAGLSIGANTLTLNGQVDCGTLTGGASSNISIAGSGTANLSAVTLNNLTVNRAVSLCGNVNIGGTLNLTSGTFTVGTYTLTLNGPTIAGTPSNLTTSSSSNLVFGGTSAGVLIPASAANLNNLTINNSSGVSLTGSVSVGGVLTMNQGNITTGSNTLALSNSSVGSLTRVSGIIIGKLRRAVNTPLANDYIFPVGTSAFYRPAILNFASLSAGTDITAEFVATPPAGFVAYNDDAVYLNNTFTEGYWRFYSSALPAATYSLVLTANGFASYTINGFTRITGRDNSNTAWRAVGVHRTQSGNDVSRNAVTNLNTTSFDFALATGCTATSMGYRYERNITIDYTKVAGGTDLYNFPVLINIAGQDFLKSSPSGQIFNANGFDIVFTDNYYNKLDHQLEYYNLTNGDLIVWVRIPTLSSSSNTIIKILYGNPQVNTDPSVTSVWDSHYKGVWHLDNNSLNDFTSFNKAGTPYNTPTYPAGWIYNSLGLNGTNQYVQVNSAPNINFAGNITVSAWVNMDTRNRDQKIAGNQNDASGGYKFGIYTNNKVEFEIRNSANTPSLNRDVAGGTILNTGQWYYLAGISSDVLDSIKTFVNGIPERPFKKTGILGTASDILTIGKEPFLSNYYFSGSFDELRISDNVRSNGWMRTEYNNQSSPSTFYSLDAAGVITNNLLSTGICNAPITLSFGNPSGGTYSGNPYIAGNIFTPPSAGTYSITYTYDAGCGPVGVTKNFIITPVPPAPAASNKEYCTNQIAYLKANSGLNIRWYSGGTLVSTANPFSTGQTAAGTYNYTVTQTVNGCESAPTTVSMHIYNGITINNHPQPTTICAGNNAVFTISASGYNLTYQWQEDGVNISDGGIYSGSTTSTLTLTNPGIIKNGKAYRCVVSTSCGASPVNSSTALLTIITGMTWTGVVSNDWNTSGNWSCGIIPTSVFSVQIPNVANKPVISSGSTGTVNNITIAAGSSLIISGNTLQIAGAIANNGSFDASNGTILMNGSAAQTIGTSVFSSNTIRNLTISNAAGVSLLGPLNVTGIVNVQNGNLASDGFLTLASSASGTALIDGTGAGTLTGNVTMQRYLPSAFGYKYVSSPFQASTVNEFGDDLNLASSFPTFYMYDEGSTTSGWATYVTTTDPLNPLEGYAANFGSSATPFIADITGSVNNGALSATLYNHNNTFTQGFNLVGNPYPSPIDWDAPSGWTKTNIDNALYYFKASTTDEYGGTYSTYINGISSDGLATAIIPSMQGFFIHVSDGSYPVTGTLGLNNSVRITDFTHPFLKSEKNGQFPLIRLGANFADVINSTDPMVIYFDEKAREGFDSYLDALKLMNTDYYIPNLYAWGADGTKLSIDALPEKQDTLCIIPLGLKTFIDGYIVFRIINMSEELPDMKINISDMVAGTKNDLLNNNEYKVYLEAGEYKDRFFLNISEKGSEIPDTTSNNNLFSVYTSYGVIKVYVNTEKTGSGLLSIYNLAGQGLFITKFIEPGHYEFNPGLKDGIYIVRFMSVTYQDSKKIFILNK